MPYASNDRERAKFRAEIERWRSIGRALIECDPDVDAADGVTCLDVWRKEAAELLNLEAK